MSSLLSKAMLFNLPQRSSKFRRFVLFSFQLMLKVIMLSTKSVLTSVCLHPLTICTDYLSSTGRKDFTLSQNISLVFAVVWRGILNSSKAGRADPCLSFYWKYTHILALAKLANYQELFVHEMEKGGDKSLCGKARGQRALTMWSNQINHKKQETGTLSRVPCISLCYYVS